MIAPATTIAAPELKHVESSVKIYFTKDYSRFKLITGNRNIVPGKVRRILKDIDEGLDVLKYCPIIVNHKMEIIDGQHRFHVAQKIKSNVWYIITHEMSVRDIARINSNTDKWRNEDFLKSYTKQENEDYKKLNAFRLQYEFHLNTCVALLMLGKGQSHGNNMRNFRDGMFKVNFWEKANLIASKVHDMKFFKHYKNGNFIQSVQLFMDSQKDIDVLIRKAHQQKEMFVKMVNADAYVKLLEQVYNS